jgi:hypothetical protein
VLIVIAVSVLAIGGLPTPQNRSYGDGKLSFSAAFPRIAGNPTAEPSPPGEVGFNATHSDFFDASVTGMLDAPIFSWGNMLQTEVSGPGNLSGGGEVSSLILSWVSRAAGTTTRRIGVVTTSWPPECGRLIPGSTAYVCFARLVVRENGVLWLVTASSPGSPALAQAFVDSFHSAS